MAEKFKPVRGTEAQIKNFEHRDGYLYFATDTGKMYLDTSERRIMVGGSGSGGGNSSILYAKSDAINEHEDGFFHISINDLEDNTLTNIPVDTVIINKDGAFYRVVKYENEIIYCTQIAVSGGTGGGSTLAKKISIDLEKELNTSSYINGQPAYALITPHSGLNAEGATLDKYLTVTWRLAIKSGNEYITYATDVIDLEDNQTYRFDFGSRARESATSYLFVEVSGIKSGVSESQYFNFATMDLMLEKGSSFTNTGVYSYDNVVATVNVTGNMEKIIDYYFDGELVVSKILNANSDTEQSCKFNEYLDDITHGYHTIRVELYQSIQGVRGVGTEPIEMEIAVNAGGEDAIIWLGDYATEYFSYDDIRIPYFVYDPINASGFTVDLLKDNAKIGFREFTNLSGGIAKDSEGNFPTFEITDAEVDIQNYYSIVCRDTRRDIYFQVVKDPTRDMNLQKVLYLNTLFDAKGRSNDESATSRQTLNLGTEEKPLMAQFNNFNWYNNGWVKGTDNNTCLRISNGASFVVPIGAMRFADGSNQKSQSHSFEFQFRIRNVQNYDSLIKNITRYKGDSEYYKEFYGYISYNEDTSNVYNLNNNYFILRGEEYVDAEIKDAASYAAVKSTQTVYIGVQGYKTKYTNYDAFLKYYADLHNLDVDEITKEYDYTEKRFNLSAVCCGFYSGKEAAPVGFGLGPQDAFFTNGTNTVNASYVENKLVNLSITYNHTNKLMSIYVNGILTGVVFSTLENPFTIDNANIVFSSNICDIDLYKFRIYDTALSLNDVVTNYAVDLKNVNVYDQNAIAVENNAINEYQFNFKRMIEYNDKHPNDPIMPYIIFDTTNSNNEDRLSWSKKTKPTIEVEFVNTVLDRAYESGELDLLAAQDKVSVEEYYLHHCPSFKGDWCSMAVQGTSSEFYPRRNYKLKFKDSDKNIHLTAHKGPFANNETHMDWFYMDNYSVGTNKFTMKIDYMESSGSYNRGLANLLKNAYAQHPLEIYSEKGALSEGTEIYNEATGEFKEKTTYYYYNHKDNIKPADGKDDNIPKLTAEMFAKGPAVVYAELRASNPEVYTSNKWCTAEKNAAHYNKWYVGGTEYSIKTDAKFPELRTTVQGFPVLAFHKKSDGTYTYIGRYNMLSDKGSDEMYGFKDTGYYSTHLDNKDHEDAAECWEFENNQRGFCSFRDPKGRKFLSFNTEEWDGKYRPTVLNDFEYRYNGKDKTLDAIAEVSYDDATSLDQLTPSQKKQIKKDTGVEVNSIDQGQEVIFDLYGNWEKAVRWVWSTCLDAPFVRHDYTTLTQSDLRNKLFEIDSTKYPKPTTVNGVTVDPLGTKTKKELYDMFMSEDADSIDKTRCLDKMTDEEKKNFLIEDYFKVADDAELDTRKTYYKYSKHLYVAYIPTEETWEADKAEGLYTLDSYTKTYGDVTYVYDSYEYRCAKFKNELEDHFDLDYVATYFVVTEVLELYDSRGKNAMFASWGPMKAGGDYIWFPLFYDMDTQLGINNTGIPSFEYYIDATEEGSYSTNDSVLWNNFYLLFKDKITQKYCQLKGQTSGIGEFKPLGSNAPFSSVDRIEAWYESDPKVCNSIAMRGVRPLSAINLDEYYKYISITNGLGPGYQGQTGGYLYDNSDTAHGTGTPKGSFFYALQGDRSLSRQQFLTNRLNYLESWLGVGSYAKSGSNDTAFWGRIKYNSFDGTTSDNWVDNTDPAWADHYSPYFDEDGNKVNEFDGEYWMTVTPSRKSYVKLIADDVISSEKYTDTPVEVKMQSLEQAAKSSPRYKEQLLYILGIDIIQSLGNLHNLYFTELHTINAPNLTSLILGWDGLDKNGNKYFSYKTNRHTFSSMPLLKELNLSNIQYQEGVDKTLDFSGSEKLQNFRATGSNFTQIKFAPGVALDTLYLPTTITELKLTEARQLKNVITEYHTPVHDLVTDTLKADKGLYIEHFTEYLDDINNSDCICNINILSMISASNLGFDSYKLLKGYYAKRNKDGNPSAIAVTDVDWSPYKLVDTGSIYNVNRTYKVDNHHYGFNDYVYNEDTWEDDIKNGLIYVLDESVGEAPVKDIAMLEDMIVNALFSNTANESGNTTPNISGIVYVDNNAELRATKSFTDTKAGISWNAGDTIDEYFIRNILGYYYPGLKFFFKNLEQNYTARFILLDEDNPNLYMTIGTQTIRDGWFKNPIDEYGDISEFKANYDFYGWADRSDAAETEVLINADKTINRWADQTVTESKDYIFYAIFSIHKYEMLFHNGDGTTYLSKIPFGETITDPREVLPSNQKTLMVTYKDDKDLGVNDTYVFKGWAAKEDGDIITLSNYRSSKNREFYAIFEVKDVHLQATPESYFVFNNGTIAPKVPLKGKITIPSTFEGKDVTSIGKVGEYSFESNQTSGVFTGNGAKITGIYFMSDSKVTSFEEQAFYGCADMVHIDYPKTLTSIGNYAFYQCYSLTSTDLSACDDLTFIGTQAFVQCWDTEVGKPLVDIALPGSVSAINGQAFQYTGGTSTDITRYNYYLNRNKRAYIAANGSEEGWTRPYNRGSHASTTLNSIMLGSKEDPTTLTTLGASAFVGINEVIAYYDNTRPTEQDRLVALLSGTAMNVVPAFD